MISEGEYSEAKDVVLRYEEQLRVDDGTECFILKKNEPDVRVDPFIFVTTNKEFAEKTYDTGDYILIKSTMINP